MTLFVTAQSMAMAVLAREPYNAALAAVLPQVRYVPTPTKKVIIYSWLSRCSTARGSSTRLSLVGTTKVKACKSFLFTEGSPEVENKEQLFDIVVTL